MNVIGDSFIMKGASVSSRSRLCCRLFPLLAIAVTAAAQNEVCLSCHDQGKKLAASAHASVACATCHVRHDEYPHQVWVPKPVCTSCHSSVGRDYASGVHGQEKSRGNAAAPDCNTCHGAAHETVGTKSMAFRKTVPATCGMCHSDVADQFKASVHGKALARGVASAPVCTDCHGGHAILRPENAASTVHPNHIPDTCGQCHGNVNLSRRFGLPEDRITTFDASFHGLASKGGSQTVANCASCHGVHNILPSNDPKSMVNVKNLPATCGKCHPGAGTRFLLGTIHEVQGKGEPFAVAAVRYFYLLVIPGTIGLMLLHNLGDWFRKLLARRFGAYGAAAPTALSGGRGALRMYPYERLSHALLVVSFVVLGWTGFALKYGDAWWAQPLTLLPSLRRNIHRGAAIVFLGVGIMHVVSLLANKKLRGHWKVFIPKWRDVGEAMRMTMFNIGLSERKPVISSHSYVEKAEYWAVLWGGIVMLLTGMLLWGNSWSLRFLPKVVLDVCTAVHWYEAILATLAILVWHIYSVMLDPDVYPLDTAFLTGRTVRQHAEEEEEETETATQPPATQPPATQPHVAPVP
jgi:cytochrome b subunit of formate dehydrogenase